MSLDELIARQSRWASDRWPGYRGRRAPCLEDNLFYPMSAEVHRQFVEGSGGELGTDEKAGKMSSLRSSSALAYNFFAPWIGCDVTPLGAAIGQRLSDSIISFEQKFRHGLSSMPPNVDVVLDVHQARPLAIECKFTEPYGPKRLHPEIDDKYFVGHSGRWLEVGLPKCQELAQSLGRTVNFRRLGVGQLLKHFLGLSRTTKSPPRLVCLWFDSRSEEAQEHREELDIFRSHLDPSIEFSALTYQEAFSSISRAHEPMKGYFDYLEGRYFSA